MKQVLLKIKSVKSNHPCKSVIQTSYDIAKEHGGEKIESKDGEGTYLNTIF